MAKFHEGCINGSLEGANYSAPIPVIGVYIAGASVLLLLIMLYDIIVAGLRVRKRWLPCKYFTLNSVILTLLGVVAKLPVDLTTPMPRPVDQLSKLTAMVFICVAMGFMLPSVKKDELSRSNTDLVALTIFVITVIVNICIQIITGVIMLFIWEHIVIMCLMLLLLAIMWYTCFSRYRYGTIYKYLPRRNREFIWNGWEGLFDNLKACYITCCYYNLQLITCLSVNNSTTGGMCLICSIILTQAAIRSLVLKRLAFCSGASDYSWSMFSIVVSQMLFVLVGCFATSYRWLTMMRYKEYDSISNVFYNNVSIIFKQAKIRRSRIHGVLAVLHFTWSLTLYLPQLFFEYVTHLLKFVLKQRFANVAEMGDWRNRKAVEGMNRCVEEGKKEPWNKIYHLLSRTRFRPMQPLDSDIDIIDFYSDVILRIGALVKVSKILLPDTLRESIVSAFAEVEEVLLFVATVNFGDQEEIFSVSNLQLLLDIPRFEGIPSLGHESDQSHIAHALSILRQKLGIIGDFPIGIGLLVELANTSSSEYLYHGRVDDRFDPDARYSSVEDLAKAMEQLFIDYVGILLVGFPGAVAKFLKDSPDEEFEKRLNEAMKFYSKVEPSKNVCLWWANSALPGLYGI